MAVVVLQHSISTGALRLGTTLRDYGHRLRVAALHEGEPVPDDLDEVDAVVTTGGHQSSLEDHAWLAAEMDYLRRAHEAKIPVIGICLGAQVLAQALGGEVGPVDGGIELGWHDVRLTALGAEDVVHAGLAWTALQMHWHRQQVTKVPDGARILATSDRCPVQAWALGVRTYAFQYHPEVSPETIETWAVEEPEALDEAGITLDLLRAQTKEFFRPFERFTDRLFGSIALYLVPADKRIQGVARDLHH